MRATREARRLRRGPATVPHTATAAADDGDGDVCELLEFLGGTLDQQQAVFTLRVVQGWGESTAAELLDTAAVWRGRAPRPVLI